MRLRSCLFSLAALLFAPTAMSAEAFGSAPGTASAQRHASGGSVALDQSSLVAYIADRDNRALHRVDLVSGSVTTTALRCAPEQVLVLDSDRVAVTLRECNEVEVLAMSATGEGFELGHANVAAEPWGLAIGPSGTLLVTSAFGRTLTALDTESLTARFSLPLAREPRGVVVTPDGQRAFVTHAVGDALSVIDLDGGANGEAASVRRVSALGGRYRNRVDAMIGAGTLHPSSSLAYTAVLSASGSRLFVPHLVVQNGEGTTRVIASGYGGVSIEEDTSAPSVAVLDVARERVLGAREGAPSKTFISISTSSLAQTSVAPSGSPIRQARAAAVLGDSIFVTSLGTNELVELDARSLDPALATGRVFEVGDGPTGVDVDPQTAIAVVWNQGSHDLSVVSLASGMVETLPVAEDPLPSHLARGRQLFHDETNRRISRDGRACASCHPEGRDDGLVWRLGDGPRQTLSLAGRLEHGPYGWHGAHAKLEDNIRETSMRLGGQGLSEADLAALASYLREGLSVPMREPPSAAEASLVERGRDLYTSEKLGCNSCHGLDQGTSDHAVHDVGSRAKGESRAAFRTPPLRLLEASAPYFHDGRYATLEALLDDNLDRMGQTSHLGSEDRAALLAFLRTL